MVEHTAVNRGVAGSSPARGVEKLELEACAEACIEKAPWSSG